MDDRTEKLSKLAGRLQDCLREADELDASVAAIKILEAHEAILDLEDGDFGISLVGLRAIDASMPAIKIKG